MKNNYPEKFKVEKGEPCDVLDANGFKVSSATDWEKAREHWLGLVIKTEYGELPPVPENVSFETLCHSRLNRISSKPRVWNYRINFRQEGRFLSMTLKLYLPEDISRGPFPVIINGDGCWGYITDHQIELVTRHNCALAVFNRTEMAEDLGCPEAEDKVKRSGGLYDLFPGRDFGAVAAWAWGYHRCVDLLSTLPVVAASRIAVTGHSRGGKTVLVAGATDERIALVNDNASGAGGSALFRVVGDGGETLEILNVFPSWFGPGLQPYLDNEDKIPFDQHCLLSLIAPRLLLSTYALDDRWSNPEGMVLAHRETAKAYSVLGAENNIAFHLRPGAHTHSPDDWDTLLDFISWKWLGNKPKEKYNIHPYSHIEG